MGLMLCVDAIISPTCFLLVRRERTVDTVGFVRMMVIKGRVPRVAPRPLHIPITDYCDTFKAQNTQGQ